MCEDPIEATVNVTLTTPSIVERRLALHDYLMGAGIEYTRKLITVLYDSGAVLEVRMFATRTLCYQSEWNLYYERRMLSFSGNWRSTCD
ncbi:hypothetical protein X801_09177 [Opisthorchis viverrini]|uniref:Uncharacterized protein n=1 Tax=Opisthorchis viverrini TaxID=6198 RepID=A0A1S8WKR9_OPIVI|nr:hypothetical protein X801_09177 [Opisthorchis viverrini]